MLPALLLLLGAHLACAGTHSLRYVYTAVSGVRDFPEFTVVGLVDEEQFMYFDSNTMKAVPKTDWMRENEGADYWDSETQTGIDQHQIFKNNIQIAKDRFNQSAGVLQMMYGCEFDDQTEETHALNQLGYDGEDFLILDLTNMRYISPVQQGALTVNKWNNDKADLDYFRNYFSTECIEWLKKYVQYGKSSLQRTVLCHATGFYPKEVTISWKKNGEDHDEDVDLGELLPNEDGTFQKTSTITVTPEEWKKNKYSCVVEHQDKTKTADEIITNPGSFPIAIIVGVLAVVLLAVIGVAGYMMYQKNRGFKPVSGSDGGSNSSAHTDPRA